ncbi:MAG: hypothetical protein IPM16_19435 [Chloroflexi bacterium]|nr:hypothetical protein [Chloroflexota bacterium]
MYIEAVLKYEMAIVKPPTLSTRPVTLSAQPKTKSFYTALRDFDVMLHGVLAASPRQILAQAKDVMRKFDAIIEACDEYEGEKAAYFRRLKLHAQNIKTNAIGTMLQAVENASQYSTARPRLMSLLGSFDWHTVDQAHEDDVRWVMPADANRMIAAYRLDQLLNAGLVEPTLYAISTADIANSLVGIVQKPVRTRNDGFDSLLSLDDSPLATQVRQLRRENQHLLLDTLLMPADAVRDLPPYADGAFGFKLLAVDGEMLTLAMGDVLGTEALGILSQQLIEMHAHLLHLELDGQLYNLAQWKNIAQHA